VNAFSSDENAGSASVSTPNPLAIGIIGAGQIVSQVHIPVLRSLADVKIAWVTDKNDLRMQSVADSYRIPRAALPQNAESLPQADVYLIATPFGTRQPVYEALAARNAALYVEKPIARSLEHQLQLELNFPSYKFGCGFQRRSSGPALLLRQMVESEFFGPLLGVQFGHGNRGVMLGSRYNGDVAIAGGGILFEVGVHSLDLSLFIAGATAASVKSVEMELEAGADIHTEADAVMTDVHGRQVPWHFVVSSLVDTTEMLELEFEHNVVSLSGSGMISVRGRQTSQPLSLAPETGFSATTSYQTFHAHWREYLRALSSGTPNRTSISSCRLTTEVTEQLYAKGQQGSRC
jgi:predicted dehydrogenase